MTAVCPIHDVPLGPRTGACPKCRKREVDRRWREANPDAQREVWRNAQRAARKRKAEGRG